MFALLFEFFFDAKAFDEAALFFLVVEFGVGGALGAVGEGVGAFGVGEGQRDCGTWILVRRVRG